MMLNDFPRRRSLSERLSSRGAAVGGGPAAMIAGGGGDMAIQSGAPGETLDGIPYSEL